MTYRTITRQTLLGAFVALGAVLCGAPAAAFEPTFDAWLRPQDSMEFQLVSRYGSASRQFDENGSAIDLVAPDASGAVSWLDTQLRAEYGVFQRFAVAVTAELRREWVDGPTSRATVSGLGDIGIAAGYLAFRDAVDLSFALQTRWPTGYSAEPGGFVPSLGEGAVEADLLVVVGRRYEAPFEFSAATGYRFRGWRTDTPVGSTNLRDQIPLRVLTTAEPRDNVRIDLLLDGALSFGRPSAFNELELRPVARHHLEASLSVSTPVFDRYRAGVGYQRTLLGVGALAAQSLLITLELEDTL
jgi:hypothetical protein